MGEKKRASTLHGDELAGPNNGHRGKSKHPGMPTHGAKWVGLQALVTQAKATTRGTVQQCRRSYTAHGVSRRVQRALVLR